MSKQDMFFGKGFEVLCYLDIYTPKSRYILFKKLNMSYYNVAVILDILSLNGLILGCEELVLSKTGLKVKTMYKEFCEGYEIENKINNQRGVRER